MIRQGDTIRIYHSSFGKTHLMIVPTVKSRRWIRFFNSVKVMSSKTILREKRVQYIWSYQNNQ